MNFYVRFSTKDRSMPLVEKLGTAGTDILDLIREEHPKYRHLPANQIFFREDCPINGDYMDVEVSEDFARASGLFHGKLSQNVLVNTASFSKYVDLDIEERHITSTKKCKFLGIPIGPVKHTEELIGLRIKYGFNEKQLLLDWKNAGFPVVWDN